MLQVRNISKKYVTGDLVQNALDDVSLNLRDNEFVAILGPSGSGKTTFLNMIGGLDRYDSGDLIINGVSTKKYSDRDWDSYRNHTVGFVFQSYQLIPHQTVLSNVELALTISGVGPAERKNRAIAALQQVGLGDQINKKPNQLSGGQMQRVAIARALVNDPDILLADEPTGALDTDTSVQVMNLLKEVASDRLVVMVTHNPELAEQYATRIVRLQDGKIVSDSDPYEPDSSDLATPIHQNMGKASMSLPTAIGLSFNNLWSKKARTLLTAFAGSIGIIGIALILSLSTGVNDYIEDLEEDTLSEYPVQITSSGFDMTSMMATAEIGANNVFGENEDAPEVTVVSILSNMFSSVSTNDLASLKEHLESDDCDVYDYAKTIEYSYNITPHIYRETDDDPGYRQVNPDSTFSSMGFNALSENSMMSSMISLDMFSEMPEEEDLYIDQYDLVAGHWPENYNELVVVLTQNGGMTDLLGYTLGLRDPVELDDMIQNFMAGEEVEETPEFGDYTYDDLLGMTFKLVNACDLYEYDSDYELWTDKSDNESFMRGLIDSGEELTIVGIVEPSEDANSSALTMGICYPPSLINHIVAYAKDSDIVKDQLDSRSTNVLTGEPFGENSNMDNDSLFNIDTSALEDAFAMGDLSSAMDLTSAFNVNNDVYDLSAMTDMGSISLSLPSMPAFSLGDLSSSIKITVDQDQMNQLLQSLTSGYESYAASNAIITVEDLADSFSSYLTGDGKSIINTAINDAIGKANVEVNVSGVEDMVKDLVTAYMGTTTSFDADAFDNYVRTNSTAQSMISSWIDNNVSVDTSSITISDSDLDSLADNLASGYMSTSAGSDMVNSIASGFIAYLNTDSAQSLISNTLMSFIDMGELSQQISQSVNTYMATAFSSYGDTLTKALNEQITAAMSQMVSQMSTGITSGLTQSISQMGSNFSDMMNIDADAFTDAFDMNLTADDLTDLILSVSSSTGSSYDDNLRAMGYADFAYPTEIDIYPRDFDSKEEVTNILDTYNEDMDAAGEEDKIITYTDIVGSLMSSVTDIINLISYVLIAFVAISLVVSSIMIGVITYISVLERQKEIGILRAIGASKGNISQVFNAESGMIGLFAGILGILVTSLLLIPGNAFIHMVSGSQSLNAVLPTVPAIMLIVLSLILTLIGGLIPSRKAANSDPVAALRTE